MAKMFYTAKEAAERLGGSEDQIKGLVRAGKLREFRDAGTFNYKIEDVEALVDTQASAAIEKAGGEPAPAPAPVTDADIEDIVLEPADDSSIELASSGSDVLNLDEADLEDSGGGTATAAAKAKEDTVVPSVGINVFDDDELDEQVDPLAQTAVTDVAGLGVEGAGSGSGILDLTRESDDTSLGAELLEEIYSPEDEGTVEMGDKTRAGIDEAIPEGTTETEEEVAEEAPKPEPKAEPEPAVPARAAMVREVVEFGPDAVSTALTAMMAVAVVIMLFAGMGAAALVRGITPGMIESIFAKLWMYAVGALGVTIIAGAATYFVAKRSS